MKKQKKENKAAEDIAAKTTEWEEVEGFEFEPKDIDAEARDRSCCFTGHRSLSMPRAEVAEKVRELIKQAIKEGYRHFINGGAVGFDTIAAEQVIALRDAGQPITLEICVPCVDQDLKWSPRQKEQYKQILVAADSISMRKHPFTKFCMKWRNELMVSKSSLVIAYYTPGKTGGTKNTIKMAERLKMAVLYVK